MAHLIDQLSNKLGADVHAIYAPLPWSLLTMGFALDTVNGHRRLLPARLRSMLPAEGELTIVSHYANAVGILLALPAAVTGALEYLGLVQGRAGQRLKQGAKQFDANKSVEANKNHAKDLAGARESKILGLATAHGLVNAAVLGVAIYNWSTRRHNVNYYANQTNVLLSTACFLGTLVSGYLGGSLVANHGGLGH